MPIQILFCCWMRLYQNGLQLPVKQDTPYIDTKRRVCIAVRVSGGADENGNDLDVSSKQRASVSFRCLLFPYTRCAALALKWSERADKEFLFLCCPHLSILIGKLINICTSGCQLLTVKFCYKAHFSSVISNNTVGLTDSLLYVPLTPPVNGIPSRETIIAVVRHRR